MLREKYGLNVADKRVVLTGGHENRGTYEAHYLDDTTKTRPDLMAITQKLDDPSGLKDLLLPEMMYKPPEAVNPDLVLFLGPEQAGEVLDLQARDDMPFSEFRYTNRMQNPDQTPEELETATQADYESAVNETVMQRLAELTAERDSLVEQLRSGKPAGSELDRQLDQLRQTPSGPAPKAPPVPTKRRKGLY